jgi:hypothetical protein
MKSPFGTCSYHKLRGHSDTECCNPHNPKGANATRMPPRGKTLNANAINTHATILCLNHPFPTITSKI